ncbi:MAG: hypothetical protein IKZ52_09450 [Bacteroidales bacterium]|nr:hypothetical protein [Bacteroidales bacterium]MBR4919425.1 hypothetical protein [Bacteroidales bacterium]
MKIEKIELIENGMELVVVRKILNQVIERVNELQKISNSYDDLENRPAIDGVTLTSETTFEDFRIPISSLEDFEGFENQIMKTAADAAMKTVREALEGKLDKDFTILRQRKYELDESMLVAVDTGKGEVFKTTLGDLLLYMIYLKRKNEE